MERARPGPVHLLAAVLAVAGGCTMATPAMAAPQTRDAPMGSEGAGSQVDAPAGWTIGALPAPADGARVFPPGVGPMGGAGPDRADQLFGLHDKYRLGGSLLQWLQPYAALTPWLSAGPAADGQAVTGGGVLLDVPVGAFTFTPSVGAGYTPRRLRPDGETVEFRSQLEIGYAFENRSRVTLGYSHIRSGSDGRDDSDVLGFTFRLPFGALGGD